MKMVKSLLLGCAAGIVAAGGAQAADLPVKAKPVEYVKVCSLYGTGYYYIPGTDVCMKVGGYVRQEWSYGYGDNMTTGPFVSTAMQATRTNGARDVVWRTRAYVNYDARQQTAYGTLRAYFQVGLNGNNSSDFSSNRAFIQIAGFTVGLAASYFDHYSVAAIAYLVDQASDTGDGGQRVFAYTAQLGNGISATLSAEEPEAKRAGVWNTSVRAGAEIITGAGAESVSVGTSPQLGIGGTTQAQNTIKKSIMPDIVANIRVDQAWGSFQVMGVLHEVSGGYYSSTGFSLTGAQGNGHPEDKWGWAVGAGLKVNLPMIGPGDYIAGQVVYSEGASRYVSNTQGASGQARFRGGNELAYGFWSDGVFRGTSAAATQTNVELTTAWGIAAGWEHFWTPSLRTSIHGSYIEVKYNANANAYLCDAMNTSVAGVSQGANTISWTAAGASAIASCNNNWSVWQIGSRTQWNVTKEFYMGFDVVYYRLGTASKGAIVNYQQLGGAAQPTGLRTLADQDVVATRLRWHRDIAP
jgi:hypothetical protein